MNALPPAGLVLRARLVAAQTLRRFVANDNWAIASDIALSVLMSLFPFLIIVTAMAAFVGSADLARAAADLVLATWPKQVAGPLAEEVMRVLTGQRHDLLTLGAVLALVFASNGIESVRIGLNRAYEVDDRRPWWLTRIESLGFVILGAMVLLTLAFLLVLGPVLWRWAVAQVPQLGEFSGFITALRFAIASMVLIAALAIAHFWLPGGWRRWTEIWPGISLTLVLWLGAGLAFGWYLDSFAYGYVTMYGGLATGMVALVFLYATAVIFLLGAELNTAIRMFWRAAGNRVQDRT